MRHFAACQVDREPLAHARSLINADGMPVGALWRVSEALHSVDEDAVTAVVRLEDGPDGQHHPRRVTIQRPRLDARFQAA